MTNLVKQEVKSLVNFSEFVEVTATSLTFTKEVDKAEWLATFKAVKAIDGCVQFWIGDLLKYCEQHWGMYDEGIAELGYSKQTLKTFKSVAKEVESYIRMNDLSFGHHALVAPLPKEEQIHYLEGAAMKGESVAELRNRIKTDKQHASEVEVTDFSGESEDTIKVPYVYEEEVLDAVLLEEAHIIVRRVIELNQHGCRNEEGTKIKVEATKKVIIDAVECLGREDGIDIEPGITWIARDKKRIGDQCKNDTMVDNKRGFSKDEMVDNARETLLRLAPELINPYPSKSTAKDDLVNGALDILKRFAPQFVADLTDTPIVKVNPFEMEDEEYDAADIM